MNVLVVDVGGSNVKVLSTGQAEPRKYASGPTLTPQQMVSAVKKLTEGWKYDVVSIGYPGPVLRGRPIAEPHNLGRGWIGFDFEAAFGCPVKLVNDAAMQAVGSYEGGRMLFLGLGTGLGSTLIVDGVIEPMELGHLPYRKGTYEDYVGLRGLEKWGKKKWGKDVADVVARLVAALGPDDVVLGGGNVKKLEELPPGCRVGANANAFIGGFRLWEDMSDSKPSDSGTLGRKLSVVEKTDMQHTSIQRIGADGVIVFYREAGAPEAPVVLLLHGFPTSSFQYRELIPSLADRYRVIAPDLPGFGFTEVPEQRHYKYSFDALAQTVLAFTDVLGLTRYSLYVFDYGAPTGFRLAMARPERVAAIVSQNGNAYEEGLGDAWAPIRRYWSEPSSENRERIRQGLNLEGMRREYASGILNPDVIAPEGYTLDAALLARPGNVDIQLDLFLDYANNVKLYPVFHEYFRKWKPPLLAIWGKHDPYFTPAGAEAFRRDNPNATVQLLETGHFALETHLAEIASAMKQFLANL